jgi:hypothetical protein
MEEMSFKRVPEGWVYRAPNPWLFGPTRYYLVNEAQKSQIVGPHRGMWQWLFLFILVLTGVIVPMALAVDEQHPFAALAAATLIGLIVGLVSNAYLYRAIRPIVAGLEPTTQRITQHDVLKTQIAVFSRGYLMFFGLLSLILFALGALRPMLASTGWDLWSLAGAVLFGTSTVYWFVLYVAKRRHPGA